MSEQKIFITFTAVLGRDSQERAITAGAALKDPDLIGQLIPSTITKDGLELFESLIRSVQVRHVFRKG